MLHPSTRILAQEIGYEPIGSLTEPFPVWTGDKVEMAEIIGTEASRVISVQLINGLEIKCSPTLKFRTMRKRLEGNSFTMAKDLTNSHYVYLNQNSYEFDYINLECYNYLNRLDSYELGMLAGLSYILSQDDKVLDVPALRKDVVKELDRLFSKLGIDFTKEEYYKRARRFKYTLNPALSIELHSFRPDNGILPDKFWKSKRLMRGYLKALFTFGQITQEIFSIRSSKEGDYLKQIQQFLLMFGINSSYTRGLKVSQLIVCKENCYRLSREIGIFNLENLFAGIDFKRFLKYKNRNKSELRYSKVSRIQEKGVESLVILKASQFVANGVILENYGI